MDVCFVSPHVYGYFNSAQGYTGGGAERQIYLLSTALAEDTNVHVVVGDYGQAKTEQYEGVTLHRAYPLHPRQSIIQPVKHFFILGAAMRRADADVYVYRGSPRNAAFVYLWTRLLNRKWVYNMASDEHITTYTTSWPVQRLFNRSLRDADAIIAQTNRQQQILAESYGVDSTVVPNGYPSSKTGDTVDREYLLWVGRFHEEQKQPHRLLEVAAQLPEQNFRLVGPVDDSVPYQREVRNRARNMPNVEFIGAVPPDQIHEQYRHAIAVVNTSNHEGFPNTFLEAWRQETPVVSLNIEPGRYLDDSIDSLYAGGDVDRLVELCERLATDPSYRQKIGETSHTYFEKHYDIKQVAGRYRSVLGTVV